MVLASPQAIAFDFEKLDVYQLALKLLDDAFCLYRQLPSEFRFSVGDQLVRAALSVSNNIAEGSGKRSQKERAHYYTTALDSTRECVSMVTVLHRPSLIDGERHDALRHLCWRVSSMLFRLRAKSSNPVHGTR